MRRLALVAAVACAHQALRVMPGDIEGVRAQVARHERVTFSSMEGHPVDVEPDHVVVLETTDGKRIPMRLDELVRDCPPHGENPQVLCGHTDVQDVVVGDRRHLDDNVDGLLRATAALAVIVALPVCSFECSSPYNYISDGVLVVGAVIVGVGLYILARNFGRPMT